MIRQYITITLRNFRLNRFYHCVNLFNLTLGACCFLVAVLYVEHHLKFDAGHSKADSIYRVIRKVKNADGESFDTGTRPLARYLEAELPEVELCVQMLTREMWIESSGGRRFLEWVTVADRNVISVFDFQVIEGNPIGSLLDNGSCFITESFAEILFPGEKAVGKVITLSHKWLEGDYHVAGIVRDHPITTSQSLRFNVLTSSFVPVGNWNKRVWEDWPTDWFVAPLRTYVLLKQSANRNQVQEKLYAFARKYELPEHPIETDYLLQPFKEIHLYTARDYGVVEDGQGDIRRCFWILSIGLLILALAGLNYTNLVTAQSSNRAQEIRLRKTVGASRTQVVHQLMGESVTISVIAFVVAAAVTKASIPIVNEILGMGLDTGNTLDSTSLLLLIFLIPVFGTVAGVCPAIVLSRFTVAEPVRQSKLIAGKRVPWLRRGLIVVQFTCTTALIVYTLIVDSQIRYITEKELGFQKSDIVLLPIYRRAVDRDRIMSQAESIKSEAGRVPSIEMATNCHIPPGEIIRTDYRDVEVEGRSNPMRLYLAGVDPDYFDTFDIPIVSGHLMSIEEHGPRRISETEGEAAVMINETAMRALGFKNAVGKRVTYRFRNFTMNLKIVGVIKDYHNQRLRDDIVPLVYEYGHGRFLAARLSTLDPTSALMHLRDVWNKFLPETPFELQYLDDRLNRYYRSEIQLRNVCGFFAMLAIAIGSVAMLGLVAHSSSRRRKEVGIRRVLGASSLSVFGNLSIEFVKIVAVSMLGAWPIAYYIGRHWLDSFAYRTEIHPSIFLFSTLLTFLFLFLTIGLQTWKAVLSNPVDVLRRD